MFNRSLLKVIDYRPWRWTTEPVYGNGPMNPPTVEGVKQTLSGVFILLSEAQLERIARTLTGEERTEVRGWLHRLAIDDPDPLKRPQTWNLPVWAGEREAVFIRVPGAVWNDPGVRPPMKVRFFLRRVWREPDADPA